MSWEDAYRVLLKIGFTGEAEAAAQTVKVSLSLVVHCAPVVLQGGFVAEGGGADVTMKHVTRVGGQHVSGQTGFTCEGRVTAVTLVRLVGAVSLHVSGQRLLVLELHPTLGAGVGLGVLAVVELLVHRQVILAAEGLGAVGACELVILLMCPLVSPETV